MKYFEEVPTIDYPYVGKIIGTADDKLTTVNTVDLMIRFRIRDDIERSSTAFYTYEWKDNDRPDTVARNYYGSADLAWLVMMSAMRFDALYDFPMPYSQFIDYIASLYGSVSAAENAVHHYEDGDGDVIDEQAFNESTDAKKRIVSVFKYEDEANESRRRVKLLSRQFLKDVLREYEAMLKRIKEARDISPLEQVMS